MKKLIEKAKTDPEARDELILKHSYIAKAATKKYWRVLRNYLEWEDLYQANMLAITEAVTKWLEKSTGRTLKSEIAYRIKSRMTELINSCLLRLPFGRRTVCNILRELDKNGDLPLEEYQRKLKEHSIDLEISDIRVYLDLIRQKHLFPIYKENIIVPVEADKLGELRIDIERALDKLPPKNREAIVHYFGLYGEKPKSYTELGKYLGITLMGARGRVLKGLEQLRRTNFFETEIFWGNEVKSDVEL